MATAGGAGWILEIEPDNRNTSGRRLVRLFDPTYSDWKWVCRWVLRTTEDGKCFTEGRLLTDLWPYSINNWKKQWYLPFCRGWDLPGNSLTMTSALSRSNRSGQNPHAENSRKSTRSSLFHVSVSGGLFPSGSDRPRSDCTPFTQAGYVGEDADVCIHRLLVAANWDVRKAGTYT